MHHSVNQPLFTACEGDGTCSSHTLHSHTAASQVGYVRSLLHGGVAGIIDSTPAGAYVAGPSASLWLLGDSWPSAAIELSRDAPATVAGR